LKLLKWWLDDASLRRPGEAGARQFRKLDKYEWSNGESWKEAKAKVTVLPWEGLIYVNGKPMAEYFTWTKDVENVIWPLQALSVLRQFNVWASTFGGGSRVHPREYNQSQFLLFNESYCVGQSEAIKVAVAQALLPHDKSGELNEYRSILRNGISYCKCELTPCSKCLSLDPRQVERKKPGLKKAHKA
jgi:small subunit ribosomal protein S9